MRNERGRDEDIIINNIKFISFMYWVYDRDTLVEKIVERKCGECRQRRRDETKERFTYHT